MTEAAFTVVTCNAKKELRGAAVKRTVHLAAEHADVILWQEIETAEHRLALRLLGDFDTFWPGGKRSPARAVPISFRRDRFDLIHGNSLRINTGIRWNYPNRYLNHAVLRDQQTNLLTGFADMHAIQQAFTTRKRYRPAWDRGARRAEDKLEQILHNRGAVIFGGDMNRNRWAPEGTHGIWTPHGTFGGAHYDTLAYAGKAAPVGEPWRIPTPSDHDAMACKFARAA